ncbi:MAG: hypothetical protein V1906_00775 [Candidatus Woesearchaeota archaeon]
MEKKLKSDTVGSMPDFMFGNGKLFLTHKDRERAWEEMMREEKAAKSRRGNGKLFLTYEDRERAAKDIIEAERKYKKKL